MNPLFYSNGENFQNFIKGLLVRTFVGGKLNCPILRVVKVDFLFFGHLVYFLRTQLSGQLHPECVEKIL